jgi:Tfp pilus assembly protein PilO
MALNWQNDFHHYRRYFNDIRRFYQQKKVKVYTEIVLSIFTTAFFLFFAIKPTLITITGLIKEIKDKKEVTQKLEEKINNLNIAQEEYFSIQDDLYLVDQALPIEPKISLLIKQIEKLASTTGVSIEAIQYSPLDIKGDTVRNDIQDIEFKIVANGDYQKLKNFLSSLNNFRRIFRIDSFGFRASQKEGELSLSFSGRTFFLKGGK